jgi:hypothetical protein
VADGDPALAKNPHVVTRGTLQFVEPYKGELRELPLDIAQSEVDHLTKLIHAVHQKIQSLDFPDVSSYPKTLEGILRFEEDLMR